MTLVNAAHLLRHLTSLGLLCSVMPVIAECNNAIISNITPNRYSINTDNSVTDTTTHLIWSRCAAGFSWSSQDNSCKINPTDAQEFTWSEALLYAKAKTTNVATPWRLPNTKELESLIKRNCSEPAIETAIFSSTDLARHWTSTAAIGYFGNAWAINFNDGSLLTADKTNRYQIRLVRSE